MTENRYIYPSNNLIFFSFFQQPYRYYVGGIKNLTKGNLSDYFNQFGRLIDVKVVQTAGKKRGETKSVGFVEYDSLDPKDEKRLIRWHFIDGVNVKVDRAKVLAKVCLIRSNQNSLINEKRNKLTEDKVISYKLVEKKYFKTKDM